MSRLHYVLLGSAVLCACACASALPSLSHSAGKGARLSCSPTDEVCIDRLRHPDLPVQQFSRPRKLDGDTTNDYWLSAGRKFVQEQMQLKRNTNRAKNLILFLGDGMGLTTISAARNLIGGEEARFSFETFPYTGLSKTYSVDLIVSDSACTATAYLCGVKGNEGTAGVNAHVARGNCSSAQDPANQVSSIATWAMDAGKWAGFATTTRVTHASPSGVYAHIAERDWEDDGWVAKECPADSGAQDIAYQLINGEVGQRLKVMMGGGRQHFCDEKTCTDGTRKDGRNLIDEYKKKSAKNVYVQTREELRAVNLKEAADGRLLGLFESSHLLYHLQTDEATAKQPTLEEMTRTAIEYVSANEEGYFLFIEGGRIDQGHHDNQARFALDETVEFSKAIAAARAMTNESDTLIVVTADHSHSFSFSGYPNRGNDIFGKAPATPADQKPYLTLNYANGPSYDKYYDAERKERIDPTTVLTGAPDDMFPAAVPLDSETHGGEDVPVFASGPWAHLFTGVYEQNAIPHMMAYAACIGSGLQSCGNTDS